eukprot:TRINITY_DN1553_c0_g2_i1.p1 TRINITY_DN1553_c0_g2~~TRINITY_DN1553_c0_g2_i1.p1  ORF type:complete len:523 (+),score=219.59 TRINITY_DN1553_c0_g2_i1:273-1841(+)
MPDKLDMELFLLGRKVKKWTKFNVSVTSKQLQWRKPTKESEYTLPTAYPLAGCTYCLVSEPDQLKALKAPHCLLLQNADQPLYLYAETYSDTLRLAQMLADVAGLRLEKPLARLVLPHAMRKKNMSGTVGCHVCAEPFGGLDNPGYKCVVCSYTVHKRCKPASSSACGLVKLRPSLVARRSSSTAAGSSASISVKELEQHSSDESLSEPARDRPAAGPVANLLAPAAASGSPGSGSAKDRADHQSRHRRARPRKHRSATGPSAGATSLSRSGEAGKHELPPAAAGGGVGGVKLWPSARGQTRSEQVDDIKLATEHELSLIRKLELDDCGNLCFELVPPPPSVAQPVTLMLPDAYPNGEFLLLFSASGDVHELGKGRSLKHIINRVVLDYARRSGQAAVPQFADDDDEAADDSGRSATSATDGELASPRASMSTDGDDDEYFAGADSDDIEHELGSELVSGASQQRILDHVAAVRKIHGDKSAGVYCDLTGDYTVRVAVPLTFVDVDTANSWSAPTANPSCPH